MMALLKVARSNNSNNMDNFRDAAGLSRVSGGELELNTCNGFNYAGL